MEIWLKSIATKRSHDNRLAMVNFTMKSSDVDGFGSLKFPTEEVKLTETSLGRLGLLASNILLLVKFSIYTHTCILVCHSI